MPWNHQKQGLDIYDHSDPGTIKASPSPWRYCFSFLAVLKDRVVGSAFSRVSFSSSLNRGGRAESVFSNNCVTLFLNLSPTTKAVAIVWLCTAEYRARFHLRERFQRRCATEIWTNDLPFLYNVLNRRFCADYSLVRSVKYSEPPYCLPYDTMTCLLTWPADEKRKNSLF